MSRLASLTTVALVKQINALAEEAGEICCRHGLALAPPAEVLAAAEAAAVAPEARARLAEIFAEILDGKSILAERRAKKA